MQKTYPNIGIKIPTTRCSDPQDDLPLQGDYQPSKEEKNASQNIQQHAPELPREFVLPNQYAILSAKIVQSSSR